MNFCVDTVKEIMGKRNRKKSVSEVLSEPIDVPADVTPDVGFSFGQPLAVETQTPESVCDKTEELSEPRETQSPVSAEPSPVETHVPYSPPLSQQWAEPRWNFEKMGSAEEALVELYKEVRPYDLPAPDLKDVKRALIAQNYTIRGSFHGKNIGHLNFKNFPSVSLSKYNGPK